MTEKYKVLGCNAITEIDAKGHDTVVVPFHPNPGPVQSMPGPYFPFWQQAFGELILKKVPEKNEYVVDGIRRETWQSVQNRLDWMEKSGFDAN